MPFPSLFQLAVGVCVAIAVASALPTEACDDLATAEGDLNKMVESTVQDRSQKVKDCAAESVGGFFSDMESVSGECLDTLRYGREAAKMVFSCAKKYEGESTLGGGEEDEGGDWPASDEAVHVERASLFSVCLDICRTTTAQRSYFVSVTECMTELGCL